MLFTALIWIMEIRSTMHYIAFSKRLPKDPADTNPDENKRQALFWPRNISECEPVALTNSTNGVTLFLIIVYGFSWYVAMSWGLRWYWLVAFAGLAVWLLIVTCIEYETHNVFKRLWKWCDTGAANPPAPLNPQGPGATQ